MGERMRAYEWAANGLGEPAKWPQGLKTALRVILTTRHPAFIFWGQSLTCFYNDSFRASLGPEKHPGALGARGRDVWPEIWSIIGPQIDQVMQGGGGYLARKPAGSDSSARSGSGRLLDIQLRSDRRADDSECDRRRAGPVYGNDATGSD